mmetsp:Transcript_17529/g.21197  ORF Transcript_17529/g.21197 Transcript_17529/m.21197 type:complete len:329 (-) Transcript_17529:557-1543(-)
MEQVIIKAKVPAFSIPSNEYTKAQERIEKFWDGKLSIPAAKKKVSLSNPEECDALFLPHNPTDAWKLMSRKLQWEETDHAKGLKWENHELKTLEELQQPQNVLRVVCISDTHAKHDKIDPARIPHGDILIHAGDITLKGEVSSIKSFRDWMGKLPHRHKIVISGNHDVSLDEDYPCKMNAESINTARENILDVEEFTYLNNDSVTVEGYNIYGSPVQPEFCKWAFQRERGKDCRMEWEKIPTDTDILVTHGPPLGFGDRCKNNSRAGCFDLLREVQCRVKPYAHVFGHVHEVHGPSTDGQTLFVNASSCDFFYRPTNPAIVFDLPRRT